MRLAYLSLDAGVPVFGSGGSSVHLRETVAALRRLGHRVMVFSPGLAADSAGSEDLRSLPLAGFAQEAARLFAEDGAGLPEHLTREMRALLYVEHAQRALLPALADFKPHAIYERYSLFSYAGIEVAHRLGIPLLLEVNAPLALEQAVYRRLVLRRTAEELEQMVWTGADALLVVSESLASYAHRLGVPTGRATVLPNGVDADVFHPQVSPEHVRALYRLEGKRVVGFAGSLKPWHDLDTLLEAVRILAREDESVHLLVVGDGPGGDRLRGLGERQVTCTGAVDHREVPAYVAAMDVVVVPYAWDAAAYFSPLKLFEAMAMAKPVVGARTGQVAEAIVHGVTGLLYAPGDAEDLAVKIREELGMPDKGAGFGAAARRWVLDGHTWERNAERIAAIAGSLAAARARR